MFGSVVVSVDEDTFLEASSGADESDEVGCVDRTPPGLSGLDELERYRDPGRRGAGALGDRLPKADGHDESHG